MPVNASDSIPVRRHPWRRACLTAALLLAGLLVSLAFAALGTVRLHRAGRLTSYVRMSPAVFADLQRRFADPPEGFPSVTTHAPLEPGEARMASGFGWLVGGAATGYQPALPATHAVSVYRAGWPLACIEGRHWSEMVIDRAQARPTYREGAVVYEGLLEIDADRVKEFGGSGALYVPWHPRWPGLVVDTLLFAAIIWLPVRGPGFLRRRYRRRHGRCEGCGYHLHGLERCPECGRAAKAAQRP